MSSMQDKLQTQTHTNERKCMITADKKVTNANSTSWYRSVLCNVQVAIHCASIAAVVYAGVYSSGNYQILFQ